jgi:hypothetical protein
MSYEVLLRLLVAIDMKITMSAKVFNRVLSDVHPNDLTELQQNFEYVSDEVTE